MRWKEGERSMQQRRKGTLPAGRLNFSSSPWAEGVDGRKQLSRAEERKGKRDIVDEVPPPARHRGRALPQSRGSPQPLSRLKRESSKV